MEMSAVSSPALGQDEREAVVCLFCGVDDSTLYAHSKSRYDDRWFDVVECRKCGLVYTNPRTLNKPREIEHRPRTDGRFGNAEWLQEKRDAADIQLQRLERFCRRGRLLDLGCAEGVLVHRALERGWDAYGIELNRNLVATANEYWGDSRLWCDPLEAGGGQHRGCFHAVISTQVFEHLENPLDMLRTAVAVLKPGGVALIDVPNLACVEERRHRGASLDPTAHLYYFTKATLTRLMVEAGLELAGCRAAPNNYSLYRRGFEWIPWPALPVMLANLTERLPLPAVGKGVFAVGRLPGAGTSAV